MVTCSSPHRKGCTLDVIPGHILAVVREQVAVPVSANLGPMAATKTNSKLFRRLG